MWGETHVLRATPPVAEKLLPHCPKPSSPPTESFAPLGTCRPNGDCTGLSCDPGTGPRHLGKEGEHRGPSSGSPWPAAVGEWEKCWQGPYGAKTLGPRSSGLSRPHRAGAAVWAGPPDSSSGVLALEEDRT